MIYRDTDTYFFIDEHSSEVSEDLQERYHLALLEWETVQEELEKAYRG